MGWLNRVGVDADDLTQKVYAFYHTTFEEYFAAIAIEDWCFFLNHVPKNPRDPRASYRIFKPQWKQIFLLWLGRPDVERKEKEKLIRALVEFKDVSGKNGFYSIRSYFLAAIGIAEFEDCSWTKEIVRQVVDWSCGVKSKQKCRYSESGANLIRQSAIATLPYIPRAIVIGTLEKLITSPDFKMRLSAVEALAAVGSEAAVPLLIQALEDPNSSVCKCATQALGKIGSEIAIPALKSLKYSDGSAHHEALEALGEIGSETAIIALSQCLKDFNGGQVYCKSRVYSYAGKILANIGSETAIPILIQALDSPDDFVRGDAAQALGGISSRTAITALTKALEDPDISVRQYAAEALAKIDSETFIYLLIKALENPSSWVRKHAAQALGKIGSEIIAIPALTKALGDSEKLVRKYTAEALGEIGSEAATPGLMKALEYGDCHLEVVKALGEIGSETAIPVLVDLLTKWFHWTDVEEALVKIGSEAIVPALAKVLTDSDNDERWRAAHTLGNLGFKSAIPALIKALDVPEDERLSGIWNGFTHPNADLRHQATLSLGKLSSEIAIPRLIEDLAASTNAFSGIEMYAPEHTANALLKCLVQNPKRIPDVVTGLRHKCTQFQCYAIVWLYTQTLSYAEFYEAWQKRWLKVLQKALSSLEFGLQQDRV